MQKVKSFSMSIIVRVRRSVSRTGACCLGINVISGELSEKLMIKVDRTCSVRVLRGCGTC